jgi:hypothetical protein
MTTAAHTTIGSNPASQTIPRPGTRTLLACGAAAGPLFIVTILAQALTRAEFDPRIHPLSLLSLGGLGWIQITNFVVAGVLFTAGAVGLRRVLRGGRGGTWGPRLVGFFGVSMVWGGVFLADAADGFPPGSGTEEMSWHGFLHSLAPSLGLLALIVSCFVLARGFAAHGRRGWAVASMASGMAALVLINAAVPAGDFRLMLTGGIILWAWASAVAARLLADRPTAG